MEFKPGDNFSFVDYTGSGTLTDADLLPTGKLVRNGAVDGTAVVTVTHLSTGMYALAGTVPSSYGPGDVVQVVMQATVGGIVGANTSGEFRLPWPFEKFNYNPTARAAQALCNDGATPFGAPVTLTLDGSGNVLSRL